MPGAYWPTPVVVLVSPLLFEMLLLQENSFFTRTAGVKLHLSALILLVHRSSKKYEL